MSVSAFPIAPEIAVDGRPLPDGLAVLSVEVDRSLNLIGRATLRFLESGFDLTAQPKFSLGTEVAIKVYDGPTIFTGLVTGFSIDQDNEGPAGTVLTVTVDDHGAKLTRSTTHQALLQQTYSAALGSVIAQTGMTSSVSDLSTVEPYILQSGTPLAFLDWVCSRNALQWWVEDNKVTVEPAGTSSATVPLELGKDLMRLSTRASDRHPGAVKVTGWDTAQQQQFESIADTVESPESPLVAGVPGRTSASGTVTVPGLALTTGEADSVGKSLLAYATSAAVTTRGTAWMTPALKPATTVEISGAGPASGSYFVTRVVHSYTTSGFFTRFTAGPLKPESLVDLLGSTPPTGGATYGGLTTAVVSDLNDDQNQGRVKVRLSLVGTGVVSEWARVLTLGGGANRGVVFHPEVGDEVLVGFENGDTRRPVVLGGLFSDRNTRPSTDNVRSGAVAYRRITSRLGHIVELFDGDQPAEQYVQLKTKSGHYVKVAEDKLELKADGKPVSITNGSATIQFSDSGDVTLEGANVTIKAQGSLKLEGTEVGVKGSATTKVEGSVVDVKASTAGTIDGGSALAVKGGTVAIN